MMDIDISRSITRLAVALVPMLISMICHEVAHGWAAWKLGDPTARQAGRLTLNPLSHFEPTGTLLFLVTALFCPFILGWAKPVPVQPRYFKNPRSGMMLVSCAGPLTNFILALLFALGYGFLLQGLISGGIEADSTVEFLIKTCSAGMYINIVLAWFNLIPIPPLDGSHILGGVLPRDLAHSYYRIGRYGMLIILVLVASGLFWNILDPLVEYTADALARLAIPARFL